MVKGKESSETDACASPEVEVLIPFYIHDFLKLAHPSVTDEHLAVGLTQSFINPKMKSTVNNHALIFFYT